MHFLLYFLYIAFTTLGFSDGSAGKKKKHPPAMQETWV